MKPHTWIAIAGVFICAACAAIAVFQERKATRYIMMVGGVLVIVGTAPEWGGAILTQGRLLRERLQKRKQAKLDEEPDVPPAKAAPPSANQPQTPPPIPASPAQGKPVGQAPSNRTIKREPVPFQISSSEHSRTISHSNDPDSLREEIMDEIRHQRQVRRGNLQGCGCLLILLGILISVTVPFSASTAGLLTLIGLVILIIGLIW